MPILFANDIPPLSWPLVVVIVAVIAIVCATIVGCQWIWYGRRPDDPDEQ